MKTIIMAALILGSVFAQEPTPTPSPSERLAAMNVAIQRQHKVVSALYKRRAELRKQWIEAKRSTFATTKLRVLQSEISELVERLEYEEEMLSNMRIYRNAFKLEHFGEDGK